MTLIFRLGVLAAESSIRRPKANIATIESPPKLQDNAIGITAKPYLFPMHLPNPSNEKNLPKQVLYHAVIYDCPPFRNSLPNRLLFRHLGKTAFGRFSFTALPFHGLAGTAG